MNDLLGQYQGKGFRLVEPDDHLVALYYKDEQIAVFNQTKLTIQELHRTCAQWLQKIGL